MLAPVDREVCWCGWVGMVLLIVLEVSGLGWAGLVLASGLAVGVSAGVLLSALAVCLSWLISLALLATVGGVISFV